MPRVSKGPVCFKEYLKQVSTCNYVIYFTCINGYTATATLLSFITRECTREYFDILLLLSEHEKISCSDNELPTK